MLALLVCGSALGQQIRISGFVTTGDGQPLADVIVGVQQTESRVRTDAVGRYEITAPPNGVLIFSMIGYRAMAVDIGGRASIDVELERAVAVLDEVIVTGYMEQRRADITGAVASVDIESVGRQSTTSVLQRLAGQVSGVQVENSGSPGQRSTVRIRGISSFQNNNPLYIIDGTPIEDDYMNWLNPNDIESIQVLKDASAASIYGSRATNGVVIIETRKAGATGAPRFTLDTKVGVATPVNGYDAQLILDPLEYHEIVRRSYVNAGLAVPQNIFGDPNSPSIPAYIWPNNGTTQTTSVDESTYSYPYSLIMAGSEGTNWWDAVFGPAVVADVNLGLSGAGASHGYNVSFNYLNQEGTAAYNRYQRGSLRANTQFETGRLRVGENLSAAYEWSYGGMGDPGGYSEDGIMGKNIFMQPVVPVYDINDNFASGKAVTLGNQGNPLKQAWANKDDISQLFKLFGNVFGAYDVTDQLTFNTRFGWDATLQNGWNYNPMFPENSEPSFANGIGEYYNTTRNWTWTNTMTFADRFGEHNVNVLLGQEAIQNRYRGYNGSLSNLISPDNQNARYIQDVLGGTKNVSSYGSKSSLLSFFGKMDYNYGERYHLSLTLRRDGSSRLAPESRWGLFPAASIGWRISREPFMRNQQFFTNIMLRAGWGVTGNQNIPGGRVTSGFGGGIEDTYYAIGGGNSLTTGYRQTSIGNANLKWERNESINLGLDLEFLSGAASLVIDAYQRDVDDLLYNPAIPATAGQASAPIVNIGAMRNRGLDVSFGYTGTVGDGTWSAKLNVSHYRNEIVRIDGVQDFFYSTAAGSRYGFRAINELGSPIGMFYGLQWDGFFEDAAAVAAHATQDGAAPGRIRFKDINEDGVINAEDRGIIGGPHPDFTAGLDLAFQMGDWDFSATFFGTYGNEIWNIQKQFTVFRNFSTNVRRDLLDYSWEAGADNSNAKYPQLDVNDTFSGPQVSDYYVEDGSYLRLRNLQIGYTVPQAFVSNARFYIQAENLYTLTGYSGLDPSLPARSIGGSAGDVRDQYRGWDGGSYPSNRIISFGISATF